MIEFANILFKCARYKEGEKNDWFYDYDSRYKPNRVFDLMVMISSTLQTG